MNAKEVFKIWAPSDAKWTSWVRPVPFVSIDANNRICEYCDFKVPKLNYIEKVLPNTAIFVDCQGHKSINEGIALAKIGYRPIPIYNGTIEQKGAMATVDNFIISYALEKCAPLLKEIDIAYDALPAFLLDSNRMHRLKMDISVFDNSWDIYHQDIPSAQYFINNGVNKIIVRGEKIQKDLSKILYGFQKKGITILFTNGYDKPKKVIIKKKFFKDKYYERIIND